MRNRILVGAVALLLGCGALAEAEVTNLSCEQTGPAEYTLTGDSHEVTIFASTDPAEPRGDALLKTSKISVTVHAGQAGQREYFFLTPDHGEQREVSIRHLPLEGTPNFRDLGGYETTDGRL